MVQELEPGNEARHTGDRLGFPHPTPDETVEGEAALAPGTVVTADNTGEIAAVTGDESDAVAGVLLNYNVYGDSTHGPFIRGDQDATVGVRGSYIADLTEYVDGAPTVEVGATLGPNGELFVKEAQDATNNIYEVVVR